MPITIDEIFVQDRENRPNERALPWEETRDGITVVVEPKPHWAEDMRVFRLDAREHCRYAKWTAHGGRTRFYGHIDTSGDDLMMKARAMIARKIAGGFGAEDRATRCPAMKMKFLALDGFMSSFTMKFVVLCPGKRQPSRPEGNAILMPAWWQGWRGRTSATGIRRLSEAKHHPRFHSQTLVRSVSLTINP